MFTDAWQPCQPLLDMSACWPRCSRMETSIIIHILYPGYPETFGWGGGGGAGPGGAGLESPVAPAPASAAVAGCLFACLVGWLVVCLFVCLFACFWLSWPFRGGQCFCVTSQQHNSTKFNVWSLKNGYNNGVN